MQNNTDATSRPRVTGPAVKRVERTLAHGVYTAADVNDTIRAWRRTGQRGNTQRRPSRRQIRALYDLAAWNAA